MESTTTVSEKPNEIKTRKRRRAGVQVRLHQRIEMLKANSSDSIDNEKEIQEAMEELQRHKSRKTVAKNDLNKLESANTVAINELNKLESTNTVAIEDLNKLKSTNTIAINDLNKLEATNTVPIEDLNKLKSTNTVAINDLNKLEATNTVANEDLNKLKSINTVGIDDLNKLESTNTVVIDELNILKSTNMVAEQPQVQEKTKKKVNRGGLQTRLKFEIAILRDNLSKCIGDEKKMQETLDQINSAQLRMLSMTSRNNPLFQWKDSEKWENKVRQMSKLIKLPIQLTFILIPYRCLQSGSLILYWYIFLILVRQSAGINFHGHVNEFDWFSH